MFLDLFYSQDHLEVNFSNEFYLHFGYDFAKNMFYEEPRRNIAYWENGVKGRYEEKVELIENKNESDTTFEVHEEVTNVKVKSWEEWPGKRRNIEFHV